MRSGGLTVNSMCCLQLHSNSCMHYLFNIHLTGIYSCNILEGKAHLTSIRSACWTNAVFPAVCRAMYCVPACTLFLQCHCQQPTSFCEQQHLTCLLMSRKACEAPPVLMQYHHASRVAAGSFLEVSLPELLHCT